MASISQLAARLVDLFGSPVTANPAKLLGNLGVSPNGNVLVGTSTDDATNKLQVVGNAKMSQTTANGAFMTYAAPAAQWKGTYYFTGSNCRWLVGSDNSAESGSNAGSSFIIARYTDAGAWIDDPISISRATGVITQATTNFVGNVNASGNSVTATNFFNAAGGVYVSNTTNSVGATGAFHQSADIGMGWAGWYGTGTSVVQTDAPNAGAAYMGMRWTHWGARHVAGIWGYEGGSTSSTCQIAFSLNSAGSPQFLFSDSGSATFAGTLTQNSDYRIKTNVVTMEPKSILTAVLSLRPVTYDRTDEHAEGESHVGFIAHEIQEVFPLLVTGEKDAVKTVESLEGDKTPYKPGTEPEGYVAPVTVQKEVADLQSVNYIGMVPYLVASIQELKRELDELRSEIVALKGNQ